MRSAGCVINDYADRKVDGHVKRTQARPLASGKIQPREALALFAGLLAVQFCLGAVHQSKHRLAVVWRGGY